MHPARNATDAGGCAAPDPTLCGTLKYRAAAQRDRIRDSSSHVGRKAEGYSHRAGSQVGGSAAAAPAPPTGGIKMASSYWIFGATITLPGETEARRPLSKIVLK